MIFGRSSSTVAVDIGSGQLKMVVVEKHGDSPRLVAAGIEPLPSDAIVGGEIMDHHMVVGSLRGLGERLGVKSRSVATAVAGRDVIVKRIRMDRMSEGEARQVIRWEAEQHVPFDMESVNLDFEILDPDDDGLQMHVLLVAAKKDLIDTRLQLLGEAGFDAAVIDLESFALQTAFEHSYDHAAYGTFCLVDVGREVTNLNLVENGRPLLTRDLAIGERKFAEELVREFEISMEEAEEKLRSEEPLADAEREVVDRVLEQLVMPVERARAFLTVDEGETRAPLDEVVLSGGAASIPGLAEALTRRLETAVTVIDPLRGLETTAESLRELPDRIGRPMIAVAVGLGLRAEK